MSVFAVVLLSLSLASDPAAADGGAAGSPGRVHGSVQEARSDSGALSMVALAGAYVLVGAELALEVGLDGTDTVVVGDLENQDVEGVLTDEHGRFAAPCPPATRVDVLVWRAGYSPVLRQGVTRDADLDFVLARSPTPDLHRALRLPTGRLLVEPREGETDLPYVNARLGLLFPIPEGFFRVDSRDPLTILSLTDGWSRVMILRAPVPLDMGRLADLLQEQLHEPQADDASLRRSIDLEVDGRRAVFREFVGRDARTCVVYASRQGATLMFVLASPPARYEEALVAFLASVDATRFAGAPPRSPERGAVLASSEIGVRIVLPEPWRPLRRAGQELAAEMVSPRCIARISAVESRGADPRPVVDAVFDEIAVRQDVERRWDLVAGSAAYARTAMVSRSAGSAPMCITVVAVPSGTRTVVARFEYPRYARATCALRMMQLLDCMAIATTG